MEMVLPEAIRIQAEQADALQQQLYGLAQPEEAQTAEAGQSNETDAVKTEPVQETVTPAVEPVVQTDPQEDWKHKFNVLRGKYDAEVPRLHQQLKEALADLEAMRSRLESVEQQRKQAETQQSLVSEKDVESFGEELIDLVRRVAKEECAKQVSSASAELKNELTNIISQVGMVQTRIVESEMDRFWNTVRSLVPDWNEVDADPNWIAFLDSTPEFATETYRSLAVKAIQARDARKIAKLVELWRGSKQNQPVSKAAISQELQRQVQPSSVKSSAPVAPSEKILTRAEYEALYDVRNVQRYGAKRAAEMIAEADRAVAEGRVRW